LAAATAKTRRRDADATKQAILDAAIELFSETAYDQVGLREIAGRAGVDVALIGRYFGSKDELFRTAITPSAVPKPAFPERSEFGEWMARRILSPRPEVARMLIVHHSAANPRAAEIVRRNIMELLINPIAEWLGGKDARLRASLIVSFIAGLRLNRDIAKIEDLTEAEDEEFVRLVAPAIQALVDGGAASD
jgi:AcrR family transcriptional regulator